MLSTESTRRFGVYDGAQYHKNVCFTTPWDDGYSPKYHVCSTPAYFKSKDMKS